MVLLVLVGLLSLGVKNLGADRSLDVNTNTTDVTLTIRAAARRLGVTRDMDSRAETNDTRIGGLGETEILKGAGLTELEENVDREAQIEVRVNTSNDRLRYELDGDFFGASNNAVLSGTSQGIRRHLS